MILEHRGLKLNVTKEFSKDLRSTYGLDIIEEFEDMVNNYIDRGESYKEFMTTHEGVLFTAWRKYTPTSLKYGKK